GPVARLESDLVHEDHRGIRHWIDKHNGYAAAEARELLRRDETRQLEGRLGGTQAERVRWLRTRVWNRLPPLVRPVFYFAYRYVLRGGFLDGPTAFVYHVLQSFWYPLLIDAMYLE